jgi:hypothetical protein
VSRHDPSAETPRRERTPEDQAGQGRSDHRGPGKSASALGRALQERGHRRHVDTIIDAAVDELVDRGISRARACRSVGRSRATHYRQHRTPRPAGPPRPRPRSHRALTDTQVDEILAVLNSERFCDQAPAQIWATLLDEGRYLASVSTMYRILRSQHQVRERRRQARHPAHLKPELVATGPNQVWSWDITKLAGPHKWTWFHLYVISTSTPATPSAGSSHHANPPDSPKNSSPPAPPPNTSPTANSPSTPTAAAP